MSTIEEKQKQRFQFLNLLYGKTQGHKRQAENVRELETELGWDQETTDLTVEYLKGEGLVKGYAMGEIVITHLGVVEIERALTAPDQPTPYFPPAVNILSGDFSGAIVNVDSVLTNLRQSVGAASAMDAAIREELSGLIDQLNQALEEISPDNAQEAEAVAWAAEQLVEAAIKDNPNRFKIEITREGLMKAAKNIAAVMPIVLSIAEEIVATIQRAS